MVPRNGVLGGRHSIFTPVTSSARRHNSFHRLGIGHHADGSWRQNSWPLHPFLLPCRAECLIRAASGGLRAKSTENVECERGVEYPSKRCCHIGPPIPVHTISRHSPSSRCTTTEQTREKSSSRPRKQPTFSGLAESTEPTFGYL